MVMGPVVDVRLNPVLKRTFALEEVGLVKKQLRKGEQFGKIIFAIG